MFLLLPPGYRLLFGALVFAFVAMVAAELRSRFLRARRREYDLTGFVDHFSRLGVAPDISRAVFEYLVDLAFAPNPHDHLDRIYGINSYRANELFAEIAPKCGIDLPAHWLRSNPVPLDSVGDVVRGLWYYKSKPEKIWCIRNARWFHNVDLAARPFVQIALIIVIAAMLLTQFDSTPQITCLAFSPDGKTVVAGGGVVEDNGNGTSDVDGLIWFFDASSGKLKRRMVLSGPNVDWIAFSPDGKSLASWQDQGLYYLQDAASGRAEGSDVARTPFFPITTAKHWLPMGDLADWDKSAAAASGLVQSADDTVLAVSADDRLAAGLKFPDNAIVIWDTAKRKRVQKINAQAQYAAIGSTAFSPDDKLLAFPEKSTRAGIEYTLWDLRTRKTLRTLKSQWNECNQLVFSGDGKLIATADNNGDIEIWNVASGQCVRRIQVY